MKQKLIHENALDRQRQEHRRELPQATTIRDHDVIRDFDNPLKADAGFLVLGGNLFESAPS